MNLKQKKREREILKRFSSFESSNNLIKVSKIFFD